MLLYGYNRKEIENFKINRLAYGFDSLQHNSVGRVTFQVLIGALIYLKGLFSCVILNCFIRQVLEKYQLMLFQFCALARTAVFLFNRSLEGYFLL